MSFKNTRNLIFYLHSKFGRNWLRDKTLFHTQLFPLPVDVYIYTRPRGAFTQLPPLPHYFVSSSSPPHIDLRDCCLNRAASQRSSRGTRELANHLLEDTSHHPSLSPLDRGNEREGRSDSSLQGRYIYDIGDTFSFF